MAALTNRYEDDDAYHLPPGMKRVGYDADTERYTFREGDDLWLGEPGSFYGGRMKWAGKALDAGPMKHGKHAMFEGDSDGSDSESTGGGELATPPSANPFHENVRNAVSHSRKSQPRDSENEWGIPGSLISAASAEPPAEAKDDLGLKRRATRLKEVATSTVDALGVARRWSRKDGTQKTGEANQDPVDTSETD